jgi:hypothetical protein
MKYLQLNRTISRIFVILYLGSTFIWRFLFEAELLGSVLMSMVIGIFFLLFLWALIKAKIINPEWFWFEDVFKEA